MKTLKNTFVYRSCLEKLTLTVFIIICAISASTAFAGNRGKVIDFEDELVEGVNKRPLDSVSQISERDKNGRRTHLYRKRASFKNETHETLTEMRVWQ